MKRFAKEEYGLISPCRQPSIPGPANFCSSSVLPGLRVDGGCPGMGGGGQSVGSSLAKQVALPRFTGRPHSRIKVADSWLQTFAGQCAKLRLRPPVRCDQLSPVREMQSRRVDPSGSGIWTSVGVGVEVKSPHLQSTNGNLTTNIFAGTKTVADSRTRLIARINERALVCVRPLASPA